MAEVYEAESQLDGLLKCKALFKQILRTKSMKYVS